MNTKQRLLTQGWSRSNRTGSIDSQCSRAPSARTPRAARATWLALTVLSLTAFACSSSPEHGTNIEDA